MNKKTHCLAAALLAMLALQACSEKTPPAPAAAPAPAAVAEPVAAAKPMLRSTSTVCADRKIVIEASCLDLYGPRLLACTSQSIKVLDDASGKLLGTRKFDAVKGDNNDPAIVDEKIGEMTCVKAKSGEKYIVTDMFNGGNCEQCEWHELYSWDGAFLGSDRDRKVKNKALQAALDAINEEDVDNTLGSDEMEGFYAGPKAN